MEANEFLTKNQYELEAKVLEKHKSRMENSRLKGEEDGKRNLPSVDDKYATPFEKEIQSKYQAEIEELFQYGKQVLDDLYDKQLKPVEEELKDLDEEKIEMLIKDARTNKEKKLNELTIDHFDAVKDIENLPHCQVAKKRFESIMQRWEEVTKKHNRQELNIHFKPYWAYILLLFVIGIAEFPLNNQVFLSFRETPLLTLIMSGVLVVTLPFLAHAAGKILKQSKERKIYPFLLFLLISVIVSVSFLTSILRANYIGQLGAPAAELLIDRWTFFTIGIILFLVGAVASFFAHDDSIEFSEVYHKFHKEEENYREILHEVSTKREAEKEAYEKKRQAIQEEFSVKTETLKNRLQFLKHKKTEITGDYNKALACFQGLERKIDNFCREAIFHYRDTNLTYRNNHKQPQAWAGDIPGLKCNFGAFAKISDNLKNTEK